MAYIGQAPANKPVSGSDLDATVITGQTALSTAPADTDEFLISDAGVLKRLDASLIGGGGKINQVVSTHTITNGTMSSNSFADISGVSVDITPSASDSKILILVSLAVGQNNNSSSFYKLLRDSTVLGAGADAGNRIGCSFSQGVSGSGSQGHIHSVNYNYLDSPSTTSQITYKVQAASYASALLAFNRTINDENNAVSARPSSVITAIEVLA